jgi:signal transduction histidine kinase
MAENALVLVIDDEEGMRDFLAFVLQTEGYQALTAAGGQEALELVEQDNIDAILTDLKMPGMDGMELLRRIRERDQNAVVVIMTAYASLQSALEAMKQGAYDYLLKPFDDVDKVMDTIARAVERRKLIQRTARLMEELQSANQQLSRMYRDAEQQAATLKQSYDELKSLDALKTRFTARFLHVLLDSLADVKGHLELLTSERLGSLSDEQREALVGAGQRADGLARLLDDVLCLQEAEGGQVRLNPAPISLAALVERTCQEMQSRAGDITLDCDIPENMPLILGDAARLQQAITHLLDNAVKFSPPSGQVNVILRQEGNQMRLTVQDQSEGIPEDQMQHIFDHFHRADTREREGGLGLELPVVKRIVDTHGGAIEVASQSGKGTTVTLILPNVVPND